MDAKKPNYDDLLEDVFGLNIRGLKSLWTSFSSPKQYYLASADADWNEKFTPSFRLWFTLVALTFFFQFFWASPNSAIIQAFAQQIEATNTLPDGVSSTLAATTFSRWYYALLPFSIALGLSGLAVVYRAFGQSLSYIERQRRIFITVIPSAFLMIIVTTAFGFLTRIDLVTPLFLASLVLALFVDGLTAYRGAFSKLTGRIWRAAALSLSITFVSGLCAVLAQAITTIIIYFKYAG